MNRTTRIISFLAPWILAWVLVAHILNRHVIWINGYILNVLSFPDAAVSLLWSKNENYIPEAGFLAYAMLFSGTILFLVLSVLFYASKSKKAYIVGMIVNLLLVAVNSVAQQAMIQPARFGPEEPSCSIEFPQIMENRNPNQRLEPIVKTPIDEVEVQGTQAHP